MAISVAHLGAGACAAYLSTVRPFAAVYVSVPDPYDYRHLAIATDGACRMKLAIPKEQRPNELRVAASPETVKKFAGLGVTVVVESGAGEACGLTDAAYKDAGASIAKSATDALKDADVVLKVAPPLSGDEDGPNEIDMLKKGAVLIAQLAPYDMPAHIKAYADAGVDAFAMELMPRITRAQSMDVLSSQANLAGYRAVIDAAYTFRRAYPLLMTAAGTVAAAQVMVMGAGVAGLQAIATAKRLGAVVSATDVRPAAKEQVESVGGKFIAVEDEEFKEAETAGGYAKEMSAEYQKKQAELISKTLPKMDAIICTANIPGRPAPKLISEAQVKSLKPGSVIVDLAAERGGNCELTEPGEIVVKHGVTIIGTKNVPSLVAADASQLYARNLFNFLSPFIDKDSGKLTIDWDDELVKGTALTRDGAVVHEQFKDAAAKASAPAAKKPAEKKSSAAKPTASKKPPAKKAATKKADDGGTPANGVAVAKATVRTTKPATASDKAAKTDDKAEKSAEKPADTSSADQSSKDAEKKD